MAKGRLSIGDVSKRTGISVKTLRFYADEGIVPPSGRSTSGYRLYSEEEATRLDLVRTLRDAGLGLEAIRSVLRRDMTLEGALRLRLGAVEAHIASLRHVAAALRAALRSEPTEQDLRRLVAVTRISNEERRAVIQNFYDRVSEGIPIDKEWTRSMVDALTPKLSEEPTPQQIDAWIELSEILADPGFVATMRSMSLETWKEGFDSVAYRRASSAAEASARQALDQGLAPTSGEALPIVQRFLEGAAAATGREPDAAFRRETRENFEKHDPRASRVWELSALVAGRASPPSRVDEWRWLVEAITHHLRE
ncbi:MAG: hypothetical protein JWO86_9232 [Myxococcaceae bacterium]|jgi:DNA-binding transcriptional MerR regulator|nr:hypothetical protein [Myxococcaceae bacterium]